MITPLAPQEFTRKWRGDSRKERSVSQEHFIDLCRFVGHETLGDNRDGTLGFEAGVNGVLHSKVHELWARATGTQLHEAESSFRYTPTRTFETYPFPWPPGREPQGDDRVVAIAAAAQRLVTQPDAWLNRPDLSEAELKQRTLTNLYNARPPWLAETHQTLDAVVLAAYGWPADLGNEEILARLLALNLERAAAQKA